MEKTEKKTNDKTNEKIGKKGPNTTMLGLGMTFLVIFSVLSGAIFYGKIYAPQDVIERQIIKQGELSFVEKELLLGKYSVFIEVPEHSSFEDRYRIMLEEFTPLEYDGGNVSFVFVEETNRTSDNSDDLDNSGKIILKGKHNTIELSDFDNDIVGSFICDNLHPTVKDNYDYCRIKEIFSEGAEKLDDIFSQDEIIAILSQTEQVTTRDDINRLEERVLLDNNRVVLEVYAPRSSEIFIDLVGDILEQFKPLDGYSFVYLIEEKGQDDTKVILVSKYDDTELEEYDGETVIKYICDHIPVSVSERYDVCETT